MELSRIYVWAAAGDYRSSDESFCKALKPLWDSLTSKYESSIESNEQKHIRRSLQFELPRVKLDARMEARGDYPEVFIVSFGAGNKDLADEFYRELYDEVEKNPQIQLFLPQIHTRRIFSHELE